MKEFKLVSRDSSDMSFNAIPALDVEQILDERDWLDGDLSDEQEDALHEALRFLDLVSSGKDIAQKMAQARIASANLAAIDAFVFASNMLKTTTTFPNKELDEIVENAEDVISTVLSGDIDKRRSIEDEDLSQTHQLFLLLSRGPLILSEE